jgi:hypothetical protein
VVSQIPCVERRNTINCLLSAANSASIWPGATNSHRCALAADFAKCRKPNEGLVLRSSLIVRRCRPHGEDLLGVFIEQQVVVAKVAADGLRRGPLFEDIKESCRAIHSVALRIAYPFYDTSHLDLESKIAFRAIFIIYANREQSRRISRWDNR